MKKIRIKNKEPMKHFLLFLLFLLSFPLSATADDETRCRQWVDSVYTRLSLEERVGQLLVASLPVRADSERKRLVREWTKRCKVGGLVFAGGVPEEQAILTNLAQKNARLPLLVLADAADGPALRLEGMPEFPGTVALGCLTDETQLGAYGFEVERQYRELGISAAIDRPVDTLLYRRLPIMLPRLRVGELKYLSGAVSQLPALLEECDVVRVEGQVSSFFERMTDAFRTGKLPAALLEESCRRVLAHKYRLGLRRSVPKLRVSGLSFRLGSEEARTLASRLNRKAVTLLNNYFDLLPLSPDEAAVTALLCLGSPEAVAPFVESVGDGQEVSLFRLPWGADEAAKEELRRQLSAYRRVVVCLADTSRVPLADVQFLSALELRAPLVYVSFLAYDAMLSLIPALNRSAASILAHNATEEVQRHVADLLFARAEADGRLPLGLGPCFPTGSGCTLSEGTKPNRPVPEDFGLKSYVLQSLETLARKGIEEGAYPGCRLLLLKEGQTLYDRGFGTHSDRDTTSVRRTDLFDLGDLTMTTATLLAVMKLYDEGRIQLDAKASAYLPFLRNGSKKNITIRELLLHESGLPPYIRFYLEAIDPKSVHGPYLQSWEDQWHRTRVSEHSYYSSDFRFKKGLVAARRSATHSLQMADGLWLDKGFKQTLLRQLAASEPEGKRYVYSHLGFILLQQVVEAVAGMPMDRYLEREFYEPMGLKRTLFLPLQRWDKQEILPTLANDFLRRQELCGYVQDEAAACLGGVAGHAGLFSTAEEVGRIYQMLLNGGELDGRRYLSEETCRRFTTEQSRISRRGLGFDRPDTTDVQRSPCAPSVSGAVYGHTGFTGTCVWVDPVQQTVFVFLSNRLCPEGWNTKLVDMDLCRKMQEVLLEAASGDSLSSLRTEKPD